MSGTNILQKLPDKRTKVINAKSSDYNTVASLSEVNCYGYRNLMVWYQCSTGWDRAGDIMFYGSLWSDSANASSTYLELDGATWSVTATDDTTYSGGGRVFVVENIPPFIKCGWNNTTAGTTGTISVWVMPFNN